MWRFVLAIGLSCSDLALADSAGSNRHAAASEKILSPAPSISEATLSSYKNLDLSLKLDDREPLARELRSAYRRLGERMVERLIGDESNGRRLKLDVDGKPGIGMEFSF